MNSRTANSKNDLYLLEWGQEVEKYSRELLHISYEVLKTEQ